MSSAKLLLVAAVACVCLHETFSAEEPAILLDDQDNGTSPGLVVLQGAGASFPNSLYQDAIFAYQYVSTLTRVKYKSTGSGKGKCRIKDFATECSDSIYPEHVDFAGSDSLLSEADYNKYPDLQMLPTVGGAVVPVYNLEGLQQGRNPDLILDRVTIAGIFRGSITEWRHPAILRLNPLIQDLIPNEPIKVVCREDKSGTTEIWKKALSSFDPVFRNAIGTSSEGGPEGWPTSLISGLYNSIAFRKGNQGVNAYVLLNKNSIGYSVLGEATRLQLPKARLMQSNNPVKADSSSIMYALVEKGLAFSPIESNHQSMQGSPDRQCKLSEKPHRYTADLVDTRGLLTWPITGYTYLIIRTGCPEDRLHPKATCINVRETLRFWKWFYSSNEVVQLAESRGFATLPKIILDFVMDRLSEVRCNQARMITDGGGSGTSSKPRVYGNGTNLVTSIIQLYANTYGFGSGIQLTYMYNEVTKLAARIEILNSGGDPDTDMRSLFSVMSFKGAQKYFSSMDKVVLPWMAIPLKVIVNIPELEASNQPLYLDLELLAMLKHGAITHWNDTRIVQKNPLLKDVNQKLILVVMEGHDEVADILQDIVTQYANMHPFTFNNPPIGAVIREESSYSKIAAAVMETEYAMAIVSQGSTLEVSEFKSAEIFPAGGLTPVSPTIDSMRSCFKKQSDDQQSSVTDLMTADFSSQGCYPLTVPFYVVMNKKITPPNGRTCFDPLFPATQTVRWWYWMLTAPNIEAPLQATDILHLQDFSAKLLVDYVVKELRQMTCSGNAIIVDDNATAYKTPAFVIIVLVLVLSILVIVITLLVHMAMKRQKLEKHINALQGSSNQNSKYENLDLESPIFKIKRFLESAAETGKVGDRDEAAYLLNLMQTSKDLRAPVELKSQLTAGTSLGTREIDRFLANIATQENGVERSQGSHSSSLNNMSETFDSSSVQSDSMAGGIQVKSDFHKGIIKSCWIEGGLYPDDLMAMLSPLGEEFFFDIVGLQELTGRRPLATVMMYLMHKFDLVKALKLDEDKLQNFLLAVDEGHSTDTPYHNSLRAADVVSKCAFLIKACRSTTGLQMSSTQVLAGLMAAAVMDYKHTGRSNAFHVRLMDEYALQFNDQHVIENYSLLCSLGLLRDPSLNFFDGSSINDNGICQIRKLVIDMVLATDITYHFEHCSDFHSRIASRNLAQGLESETQMLDKTALKMIIKVSDLGYFALPLRQHLFWSKAREQESFQQGDDERAMGMPVSPLMDRNLAGQMDPNCQAGYMDVLVMPMLMDFTNVFPSCAKILEQAHRILEFWKNAISSSNSAGLLNASLEAFCEELVSQANERYENIVGTETRGNNEDEKSNGRDVVAISSPPHSPTSSFAGTRSPGRTSRKNSGSLRIANILGN